MAYINHKSKHRLSFLTGMSGILAGIGVVKSYRDKTVLCAFPKRSWRPPSEQQVERRARFNEAVKYARSIMEDPKEYAKLKKKLRGRQSVYHAAISQFMSGRPWRNNKLPLAVVFEPITSWLLKLYGTCILRQKSF